MKVVVKTPTRKVSVDGSKFARGRFVRRVRLEPGQRFRFIVDGSRTRTSSVRCLPSDFPEYSFERAARPHASFYGVTSQRYAFFFDRHGVPVWWHAPARRPFDLKVLADGSIAWADHLGRSAATDPAALWEVRSVKGPTIRTVQAQGTTTDFHDLQQLPNGNFLVVGYAPRSGANTAIFNGDLSADVVDAEVQEVTPTGRAVWRWNSRTHIRLSETGRWWDRPDLSQEPYDLVHINAAEPLPGGDVLVSLRHTDAVYRISRFTGDVLWKLGGTETAQSLTVIGDPAAAYPLGGQHDVRLLPDGSISVFDNGTGLGRAPRAVRYRVNEARGTATLVESVRDPEARKSDCCGSARRMADGSWVMAWGLDFTPGQTPLVSEFDPAGFRTFTFALADNDFTYRAFPVTGQLSRKQYRAGMDAQYPRRVGRGRKR